LKFAGGRITDADWEEVLQAYGRRCLNPLCRSTKDLTIDHVVPAPEGRNDKTNVQPLCRKCNASKKRKVIDYRPDKGARWRREKR
jgi:5-methylcytosine-specific restriction endonuclease McrA